MAIKINTPIHTKSGLEIASGAIVTFDVTFPATELKGYCSFKSYPTLTDLQEGKTPLRDRMEEYGISSDIEFTKAELTGASNPLPLLESKIKDYIEAGTGVGTCEIIDIIPS